MFTKISSLDLLRGSLFKKIGDTAIIADPDQSVPSTEQFDMVYTVCLTLPVLILRTINLTL